MGWLLIKLAGWFLHWVFSSLFGLGFGIGLAGGDILAILFIVACVVFIIWCIVS